MNWKCCFICSRVALIAVMLAGIGVVVTTSMVQASEIQDYVRVKGLEQNELQGIGLAAGLNGTGDSMKKNLRVARYLFELNRNSGMGGQDPTEFTNTDSIAEVIVSVKVPATGAREGDLLDAQVNIKNDAKSLKGGFLIQTFLRISKNSDAAAVVSGRIDVDPSNPRSGTIHNGCQMLADFTSYPFDDKTHTFTLVLNQSVAGVPSAQTIAEQITQQLQYGDTEGEGKAWAASPNEVVVHVSDSAWPTRQATLRLVLLTEIDSSLIDLPARVVINRRTGVIVVTGDVEIAPGLISSRGLTITQITPPPIPTPQDPVFDTKTHVEISTGDDRLPQTKSRLQDLINALDLLKVGFDEQVDILYELHKAGLLHADVIESTNG